MPKKIIPVFPNVFPWNELLLDGKIFAKTRNWNWGYRGPVLLYTSKGRVCKKVAKDYGLNQKDSHLGAIVGIGILENVRILKKREKEKLFKQFNPHVTKKDIYEYFHYGTDYGHILPGEFGFFFSNLKRLKNPIPFKYPAGAVLFCKISITPLIRKELQDIGINL